MRLEILIILKLEASLHGIISNSRIVSAYYNFYQKNRDGIYHPHFIFCYFTYFQMWPEKSQLL